MLNNTRIESGLELLRNEGIVSAALAAWRYGVLWSSIAPLLRRPLPKTHQEKLIASADGRLGYWPRIRNPRSFNEKILHRKLFTDDDRYVTVQDKWAVRDYVEERVGSKVLTDVYHVTDDPETIPFSDLPDRFVVKATHGSGMIHIVEDTSDLDTGELKARCREWLSRTYGKSMNEYYYADIPPRILVEEYLHDENYGIPLDFKFLVFHGSVEYIDVHFDRFGDHVYRLFDRDWTPLDVRWGGESRLDPKIGRPELFEEMIDVAETLGAEFDFIRVDLYQPNADRIAFGELTVTPAAGWDGFEPQAFDFELGSYW